MNQSPRSALHPTVETFRVDPLYPRVARAVREILVVSKVVAPVDVLIQMGLLARGDLEGWRLGRTPYLERVIDCNLTRLGRLLRILRMHTHDLCLVPSMTAYVRWGKGPKTLLRFSKTGDPGVEKAYARHFVWPGKSAFPLGRLEADGRPKPALSTR
jgi:hypothetical protein